MKLSTKRWSVSDAYYFLMHFRTQFRDVKIVLVVVASWFITLLEKWNAYCPYTFFFVETRFGDEHLRFVTVIVPFFFEASERHAVT